MPLQRLRISRPPEQASGGLYTTANDLALFVVAGMTGPSGEDDAAPGHGEASLVLAPSAGRCAPPYSWQR